MNDDLNYIDPELQSQKVMEEELEAESVMEEEPETETVMEEEPEVQDVIVQESDVVNTVQAEPSVPEWLKQPSVSKPAQTVAGMTGSEHSEVTRAYSFSEYAQNVHRVPVTPPPRPAMTPPVTPPPIRPAMTPPVSPSPARQTVNQTPPKKKKKSGLFTKVLICILLAMIFGGISGCVFVGVNAIGTKIFGLDMDGGDKEAVPEIPKVDPMIPQAENEVTVPDSESTETAAPVTGQLTVAQVAERCMPAMVAITNTSIAEIPNYFGFGSQSYESTSSGSGIIIDQNDTELLIATNNHVISGANTLTVAFIDDTLVEAIVKGTDVQNDLAVVSVKLTDIPAETLAKIRVIEIGDSDALAVGDQVVAIGNALGYGQSVSSGWVSALNREVTIDNTTLTLLQTDAAINPGNSGGALLNMRGELVAINESKYADTTVEGMGYAIPVSTATPILAELMSKTTRYKVEEAQASYLGISCKDISPEFAMMYNVPIGVYVDSVEENGPAALGGIKKGDIITKFDGTSLSSYTDLVSQLEYYAAGESIEVVVARAHMGDYQEEVLTVTLGSRNDSEFIQRGVE